jgi:hypothetical protein
MLTGIPGLDYLGGYIGSGLGSAFKSVTGLGDYHMGMNTGGHVGAQFGNGRDSIYLTKREFLGDVSSSTDFEIKSYAINPGLPETFPWGSALANQFEQWEPQGIMFEFVSTSANALDSTNTALGQVALTCDYNPSADTFNDMSQVLNNWSTVIQKPSCSFTLPIECAPSKRATKLLFVRSSAIPSNQDRRFYDLANLMVATSGSQASATIGQLWVTYKIKLSKPVLPEEVPTGGYGCGFINDAPTPSFLFGNQTDFSTGTAFNTIGATLQNTVQTPAIIFPQELGGLYNIAMTFKNTGQTTWGGMLGVTGSLGTDLDTYSGLNNITGSSGFNICYNVYVALDSTVPIAKQVSFSSGAAQLNGWNSGGYCQVIVDQVPSSIADLI